MDKLIHILKTLISGILTRLQRLDGKVERQRSDFEERTAFVDEEFERVEECFELVDERLDDAGNRIQRLEDHADGASAEYVNANGDTMTGNLRITPSAKGEENLYVDGGAHITGNLRLKPSSGNYGNRLSFGDDDHCYIEEPTDDRLHIHSGDELLIKNSDLSIDHDLEVGNDAEVLGDAQIVGDLRVNGDARVDGYVQTKGFTGKIVTRDVYVGGNYDENDNIVINGPRVVGYTENPTASNQLFISTMQVPKGGRYCIAAPNGSNYVFKVQVQQEHYSSKTLTFSSYYGPYSSDYRVSIGDFEVAFKENKSKIDYSYKTFSDGWSGSYRFNYQSTTPEKVSYFNGHVPGIFFDTAEAATVKVWWVSGGSGRKLAIYSEEADGGSRLEVGGNFIAHGPSEFEGTAVFDDVEIDGRLETSDIHVHGFIETSESIECGGSIKVDSEIKAGGTATFENDVKIKNNSNREHTVKLRDALHEALDFDFKKRIPFGADEFINLGANWDDLKEQVEVMREISATTLTFNEEEYTFDIDDEPIEIWKDLTLKGINEKPIIINFNYIGTASEFTVFKVMAPDLKIGFENLVIIINDYGVILDCGELESNLNLIIKKCQIDNSHVFKIKNGKKVHVENSICRANTVQGNTQDFYSYNNLVSDIKNCYLDEDIKVSGNLQGYYGNSLGPDTKASSGCTAEGDCTVAIGYPLNSEGEWFNAGGAHAEGIETLAYGSASHAEGHQAVAIGYYSHAEGGPYYSGDHTVAFGSSSHAEGDGTITIGHSSHAEGVGPTPESISIKSTGNDREYEVLYASKVKVGNFIVSKNIYGKPAKIITSANKIITTDIPINVSENKYEKVYCFEQLGAWGAASHTEGDKTYAKNEADHAEGIKTKAAGFYTDSEGNENYGGAHAEGIETQALGYGSHAEGINTLTASNERGSHAEGGNTQALGSFAHAEGWDTVASGNHSHAEGYETRASSNDQHVQGKYNLKDTESKYAHIVGNGTYANASNAHTLDWDGNAWYSGDVYVGSTSGTNRDEGSKKLATEDFVTEKVSTIEAIAKGRATGYVFDTKADLDAWLLVEENVSKLNLGDNLYIRAKYTPDYWWDGTAIQELETQNVAIENYYTKSEVDAIVAAEIAKLELRTTVDADGNVSVVLAKKEEVVNG